MMDAKMMRGNCELTGGVKRRVGIGSRSEVAAVLKK